MTTPEGLPGEVALAVREGVMQTPEEDMAAAVVILPGNLITILQRPTVK
jgi:hypothetical protein